MTDLRRIEARGRALLAAGILAVVLAAATWFATRTTSATERVVADAGSEAQVTRERRGELAEAPLLESARRAALASAPAAAPTSSDVPSSLTFRVATRESLMPNAAAVPRISVAIGVGSALDPSYVPLVEGRTGDDGTLVVELARGVIDAASARGEHIWARVVERGYQQRVRSLALDVQTREHAAALIAFRGATVRGRVVDAERRPIAAKVRVVPWLGERGFGFGGQAEAREDGWFEVHLSASGAHEVIADAGELGTGTLRDVRVNVDELAPPLEVVVTGPGIVRGRVRDDAGAPAAGLDLEIAAAGYDAARAALAVGSVPAGALELGALELEGRGRVVALARTAGDGTFEVRGLRDDLYVVRAVLPAPARRTELLTPIAVKSDGKPLQLVRSRPHLAVHVVDERGRPHETVVATHGAQSWFDDRAWPKEERIAVGIAEPGIDLWGRVEEWVSTGRRVGPGEFVFDVVAGRRYRVGALGGAQRWTPIEVDVPGGAGRVDVRLVLPAAIPTGELLVQVHEGEGRRATSIAITIEDPATGAMLVKQDGDTGGQSTMRLPEGEYRVVVEGAPFVDFHHGTVLRERGAGRFETLARVVAGSTTRVSAVPGEGARLRVQLEGRANDADRAAIAKHYAGMTCGVDDWNEVFAARATLVLLAPDRRPIEVQFIEEWLETSAAGKHLTSFLALGATDVSQIVPAGRFTLEARLPGGRVARTPVVLVDGGTTDVELAFE